MSRGQGVYDEASSSHILGERTIYQLRAALIKLPHAHQTRERSRHLDFDHRTDRYRCFCSQEESLHGIAGLLWSIVGNYSAGIEV